SLKHLQSQMGDNNYVLNALLKEKKESEKILNNIMSAVEQGLMNNTTIKRMNGLERKLAELEKSILIEQSKDISQITEEDIKEFYIKALKLEPQMLINYLVKEIKAFDDKIEITFNSPLRTGPDYQGLSFVSKLKQVKYLSVGRSKPIIMNVKLEICV
ncbi:MAG: hypothetical protein ACLRFR_03265, partial [Clostridia bacterium]